MMQLAQDPFYSLQGEGIYTGRPSVFLRFFGCNMKCPLFPCDTQYAWNKDMRDKNFRYTVSEVIGKIDSVLPNNRWNENDAHNDVHLVITGGEPLLKGTQKHIIRLLERMDFRGDLKYVTIETNGTQPITEELAGWLLYARYVDVVASISTKLKSVSGEKNGWDYKVLAQYHRAFTTIQYKVVVDGTDESWAELEEFRQGLSDRLMLQGDDVSIWVMPIGATAQSQMCNKAAEIADKALSLGYCVSARVHAVLYNDAIDK